MASDNGEKKKRSKTARETPLGRFILRVTGAQDVIEGFEGEQGKRKRPEVSDKARRSLRRLRTPAGQRARLENGELRTR